MHRGDRAAAALDFPWPCKYRVGGDDNDQPLGRSGGGNCRKTDRKEAYSRATRSARAQLRQQAHSREPQLGAGPAATRRPNADLSVDRTASSPQRGAAAASLIGRLLTESARAALDGSPTQRGLNYRQRQPL